MAAFKKTLPYAWRNPRDTPALATPVRGLGSRMRCAVGQKNQLTYRWRQERLASSGHPRSTHPINLPVRRGNAPTRGARPLPSCCPLATPRRMQLHLRRNRNESHPRRSTRRSHSLDQAGWLARRQRPSRLPKTCSLLPLAAACAREAQPSRKHLAVHAGEPGCRTAFQILRRNRRPLLLRVEHAHRSNPGKSCPSLPPADWAVARSIIVRVGIMHKAGWSAITSKTSPKP